MEFVRSKFGTNEPLPVEHFFPRGAHRPKSEEKSVQLAEVHLYQSYSGLHNSPPFANFST